MMPTTMLPISLPTRRRADLLIMLVAVISIAAYVLAARSIGATGFPLDDSWIHQTYGRNLAQTGQWEYVPGVPSAGSTSPFFTLLLAIGYVLHLPYQLWTFALGAAALALGGIIGARLAERLFPTMRSVGLWTGLVMVTAWHLVWAGASGMETMLFCALCLWCVELSWRQFDNHPVEPALGHVRRGAIIGALGAILVATRPEGAVLLLLIAIAMLISRPQGYMLWLIGAVIGGAIFIAPYLLNNYHLNGTLLPNTSAAKQAENGPLLTQPLFFNLWAMIEPLSAGGQLLLLPGTAIAVWQLIRRFSVRNAPYLVPIVWSVALVLLYTLRLPAPYQHGRYVIPALPAVIVYGVGGMLTLITQYRRTALGRVLTRSLALITLGVFLIFWGIGARTYGADVQMIDSEMVVAANWLTANIPADNTNLLAVHDIGAVGYFAPRPILDLAGLVSPEVIPIILNPQALMNLMQQRGVKYLMVLPTQKYQVAADNDPRLCLRFNANGKMQGMRIYELAWDGHCS